VLNCVMRFKDRTKRLHNAQQRTETILAVSVIHEITSVLIGSKPTKASVIPIPARRMGVSPILGLILVPTKGPIGVSCSSATQTNRSTRERIPTELKLSASNFRDASYPRSKLIVSTPYQVRYYLNGSPELIDMHKYLTKLLWVRRLLSEFRDLSVY
jgi:hypothetical protein